MDFIITDGDNQYVWNKSISDLIINGKQFILDPEVNDFVNYLVSVIKNNDPFKGVYCCRDFIEYEDNK